MFESAVFTYVFFNMADLKEKDVKCVVMCDSSSYVSSLTSLGHDTHGQELNSELDKYRDKEVKKMAAKKRVRSISSFSFHSFRERNRLEPLEKLTA